MSAKPPLCVICNPAATQGRSGRRLRRLQRLLGAGADYQRSDEPGQAEELARQAAETGYLTIVAAGGDGTVHEVVNGMLRAGRHEATLGVIPLGSGNDYAASLGLPAGDAELCELLLSGRRREVDVGRVEDGQGRARFFVNTLGVGLNGAVVWEVQKIRWLRGMMLYGLGALRAIWKHFKIPEAGLTIDGQDLHVPTLFLTVALGRREGGGFLVAPLAELDDGLFDYLHAGRLSRWQVLRYLPGLACGRIPEGEPEVHRGRCQDLQIRLEAPVAIHVDGELFGQPDQVIDRLTISILPGALAVCGGDQPK
jgi:YegS/Rv2252/BmrU family lipid kinase